MKKRLLALMLVGCFALTACGSDKTEEAANEAVEETEEASEEEVSGSETEGISIDISAVTEISGIPVVDEKMTEDNLTDFLTMDEYKGMELEKTVYTVTDEDVDTQISSELASLPIEITDTNEVVEMGDTINLDYSGSIDGVVFDGGTAEGQTLEIGSGMFIDGFEDQMIGMHVGESGEIEVTFPEDYASADLAGKDAVFAVTVNSISEYAEEVTEEWLLANTAYTTEEEYREAVRANLETQNTSTAENEVMTTAWQNALSSATYIQYSREYVESSYEEVLASYENYATMYGMELQDFMSQAGYTEDLLLAEVESYVQMLMVMDYICLSEGVTTDSQVYLDKQTEILLQNGLNTVEEAVAMGVSEWNVAATVKNGCVMDILMDNAVITEVPEAVEEATETE